MKRNKQEKQKASAKVNTGGERINKYMAEAGICSRREADSHIDKGLVTINGKTAVMGNRVKESDEVCFRGKPVRGRNEKVVLAFYKPEGITCTEKDKFAEKNIIEYVNYPIRITYAGRLDKDSEGLILLTNDGELIQRLTKGMNRHEKEYIVKVTAELTDEFLQEMGKGVYLEELGKTTRPCEVEKIGKYTFRIILTQGMNRQIRRMCQTLGYRVKNLKRVRILNILLGDLPKGKWRIITGSESDELYRIVGLEKETEK